ncbi:[protein-PII] uridylyltransferase [Parvularcula sp. IMCC14364]|uniref:[protein-PII] uridylyltransferase n=1 Tax=Parvularcula sp. IMCC14364 TaxID=3067902 RepID=UPI002741B53C|nr:[protein-PII] uridylyltransferase [Parvularcula sp. IMCC14364]
MSKSGGQKRASENLRTAITRIAPELSFRESSFKLGQLIRDTRSDSYAKVFNRTRKGEIINKRLSDVTDAGIKGLFEAGAWHFPEEARYLAILAVGGYGRGALAPYSDIDLLFLHAPYARQKIKPLTDFILYALWDTGFSIAQCVHSPASAVAFAKEDLSGNTSFLDARMLIGEQSIVDDFRARYEKHRQQTVREFVEAKLEEREQRLSEDHASRYQVEPDVKEGKGGVRDLQTIHWLARYTQGSASLPEHHEAGVFSDEEAASYRKSLDFMWSVRVQMHDLRGRADERLTFDIQPAIAERLGYQDRERMPAAERLMKHYFITAAEVGRLTGVICASLEEAELKSPRLFVSSLFQSLNKGLFGASAKRIRADEIGHTDNFALRNGRLDFVDHASVAQSPVDMFRLFRIAGRAPACDIHPDALKTVASEARFLDKATISDPEIATCFEAILTDTEDTESILRDMTEVSLLGSYFPVFGRLVGRVKYGLFRTYTLEEHTLKSIGILIDIMHEGLKKEYPISTGIILNAESVLPYFLAVALQEAHEALPHLSVDRVEREVRKSIRPLLADKARISDIIWVVTNHKLMAGTAARRNIMEARLVQSFCEDVGSVERLNLLMVLTACRLRVLGLQSSDNWTRRDITVLYEAARAWLENGNDGLEKLLLKRRQSFRNKTARYLNDWSVPELEKFFARLDPAFFDGATPLSAARFARLTKSVDQTSSSGKSIVTELDSGLTEVMVYSRDRPGLYASVAGTIAAVGGSVRASSAFPVTAVGKGVDMAANIFVFRRDEGRVAAAGESDSEALEKLTERFDEAITSPGEISLNVEPRIGDRTGMFEVAPEIIFDQDASEDSLIVETRGLDRPGLLYELSSALRDVSVSIRSAYVATYGELAIDTFYVQDLPGYKITDKRRQEVIRRKLKTVLLQQ